MVYPVKKKNYKLYFISNLFESQKDISAAKYADVLFVKSEMQGESSDLATYCRREKIPHILFDTFSCALGIVQDIVLVGKKIQDFCVEL